MVADKIRAVLEAKADALVRRAAADLTALIDPGFIYVNARGTRFDRAGYVEAYCASGRIAFSEQLFSDLEVRPFASFAVATMTVNDSFVSDGRTVVGAYRSLCVFSNARDRWLWAAGQTMAA
ncbi:MAG: hypothetical protein A3D94_16750 [Alphaproteobacteria bacterium RIFCSPHIGHO2_12_FULL_66_14]|nr:MAG: hypothetical protein A3D94_16750 [Alphaproteobacteria bacterium RIFCSPHIGHO2_12_FULL_66_14]